MIPPYLEALVRNELGSMFASRAKLAIGIPLLTAGATAVFLGFVLAGAAKREAGKRLQRWPRRSPRDQPKARATCRPWRSGSRQAALSSMKQGRPIAGAARDSPRVVRVSRRGMPEQRSRSSLAAKSTTS